MKNLKDENCRLKHMFADLSMQADLLKEALGKSDWAISVHYFSWKLARLPKRNGRKLAFGAVDPTGGLVSYLTSSLARR